ncbi:MAG TPA: hypothetical protein PLT92_13530 [Ignavibacteriaceae bacterium]|nr:hypothetical protein [Ignavibacteriaceae bacterium]
MALKISNHICQRFIERFNPNLGSITNEQERLASTRRMLSSVINDAKYTSDNVHGVLLYHRALNANIIIRNKTLITIYQKTPKKSRERNHG